MGTARSSAVVVLVTPNVHKIHHSRLVSETNSNYANLLTIYDRLLGTYTPAERAQTVVYGLDDDRNLGQASFTGLVTIPFQRRETRATPDTKVRIETGAGR
jgi:sterol desaturase/sphingolipid hydroxylase (fatty acid hydroxylase superfamily)